MPEREAAMSWPEFGHREPELAAACRALMYQFGVGLAFLATIRADGGPRVHPVCPIIADDGLYAFVIPSPKRADLHRDPRFAMHSFPADENEDAFSLTGRALPVADVGVRDAIGQQLVRERSLAAPPPGLDEQELFEFRLDRCLHTLSKGHGDLHPAFTRWRLDRLEDPAFGARLEVGSSAADPNIVGARVRRDEDD
jgi:Pyridoxamine 5'-phosphate oxidase